MKTSSILVALGLVLITARPAAAQLNVLGEAGIQAFSGPLSSALRAGPAWGLDASLRPGEPLGLELRYQGASNQLYGSGNLFDGPRAARVVQHGGEALAYFSMVPSERAVVEPFLAGGVGLIRYSLSNPVAGFQDDTLGEVPLSAGLNIRPRLGGGSESRLTIGLRADYKVLFDDQFAPTQESTRYGPFSKRGGDTYRGELTIGGNF